MIYTKIGDGHRDVKITEIGELAVGDLDASKFFTASTAANNVPVNVVPPKTGYNFYITAIILAGDRSIGANGAITDVYENTTSGTDATVETSIYQDEIAKQTRAVLTGLKIKVTEGKWINVKSDDVIVRCNIAGFYVETI